MAKKKTKLEKMSKKEKTSLAYALATNLAKHGKPQSIKEEYPESFHNFLINQGFDPEQVSIGQDIEWNNGLRDPRSSMHQTLKNLRKDPNYYKNHPQSPTNERKLTKGEENKKEKYMGKFKKAFSLEEIQKIKEELKNPKKADLNKDGKLSSYEKKRGAAIEKAVQKEDIDIGHEDNEPKMLKKDLYRIAKYASELYNMISQLDQTGQEIDFPQWWQAKIITSKEAMVKAKHYLDGELAVDKIDNMLGILDESHTGNPNDKYVVRPCKNKKEPWAVWEGEVRVKGFATKEEAQKFADKKNKEQSLSEEDKEYKVLSTKELNRLAALPPTHPSHKKDRRYKRLMKKKNEEI